jgi:protocatechuate 3,4-dioxygenase beta subunit
MSDPVPFAPVVAATQPALDSPAYRGTRRRHPLQPPIRIPHTITEDSGPRFDPARFAPLIDMTLRDGNAAIGERIVVGGKVTDGDGRPVPFTMIEIWQANACGRYDHPGDTHDAPLDPNFHGSGRVFTDADGNYRFKTVKPGAYPWPNDHNAWRPNHIHLSLFGPAFATRLITQMYFPGDPLLEIDPIFHAIADADARARLVSRFDLDLTEADHALGYRFDIVLRGRAATPMEH